MRYYFLLLASAAALDLPAHGVAAQDTAAQAEPVQRESRVAQSLIDRGVRMMNDGDLEEAISELDNALAISPRNVWAWANRAMSLAQLDRNEEAREALAQADDIDASNFVALRTHGYLALNEQNYEASISAFDNAIAQDEEDGFSLYYRGMAHWAGQDRNSALADVERAIAASSDWITPYPSRVALLMEMERNDEAIAAAEAMLEAFPEGSPSGPYAAAAASDLLMRLGEEDRSDQLQRVAMDTDNPTPLALYNSALRRDVEETELKLEELSQALEISPNFTPALYARAEVYWLEYRLQEALADIDRAIELQPEVFASYYIRGNILADMDRETEVARMAAALVAEYPGNIDALATAISIYTNINYRTRAGEVREQLREIAPDHLQARDDTPRFVPVN